MKDYDELARRHGWVYDSSLQSKKEQSLPFCCGLIPVEEPKKGLFSYLSGMLKKNITVPDSYDWRPDSVTPVKDQGSCGSCSAFATCSALESQILIENPDLSPSDESVDLSEAHLFFCNGHKCSKGSTFDDILSDAKKGVTLEEFFPYDPSAEKCKLKDGWNDHLTVLDSYSSVEQKDIKKTLVSNGPLVIGMKVYTDFFGYKGGIYSHAFGVLAGYHAVLLVGYGFERRSGLLGKLGCKTKFWICKNSWAEDFGEDGFFRIKEGECSIGNLGVYSVAIR